MDSRVSTGLRLGGLDLASLTSPLVTPMESQTTQADSMLCRDSSCQQRSLKDGASSGPVSPFESVKGTGVQTK